LKNHRAETRSEFRRLRCRRSRPRAPHFSGIPYRRVRFQVEDRARPAGRAKQGADFDLGPRARRLLI
jgi:hypothetical protein